MPFIERDNYRIHYEIHGEDRAPPLLLIMGFALSSRAWLTLPQQLSDRFRVVVFDNAGTGRSTKRSGLYRIAHLADDAAAVLDAAGADRAHVFGISMGGMIAIELAINHADRIRALALGATHANYLRSRKPSLRTMLDLAVTMMRGGMAPTPRLARVLISAEHFAKDAAGFADWVMKTEYAGFRLAMQQFAAIARHAAEKRLEKIAAPALIICGDDDRLVPVQNSRRLAEQIRGARLIELPRAGHCFPIEREEETISALSAFFSAY